MTDQPQKTVTALLVDWCQGDKAALDDLVPVVYRELRRVARAALKGERGHSLQTTALVRELYLRLVEVNRMTIESRGHFFALAGRLMRQILVDYTRRRLAARRGGGVTIVRLEDVSPPTNTSTVDVLALNEALQELSSFDPRLCRVVELRYFAGLTNSETAEALQVSRATVERDWAAAKAWLYQRLSPR
jgi:RNA polymerase sigma factor (TIGR02999 family)